MQLQQQQLDLERFREDFIRDGKITMSGSGVESEVVLRKFDIVGNLRMIPKFNEDDVECFFLLFERVVDNQNWPKEKRALMLHCFFDGRAKDAFSSLSVEDAADYQKVKTAVLRAYELVTEVYRQKFRTCKKAEMQTHVEFVRDISIYFNR